MKKAIVIPILLVLAVIGTALYFSYRTKIKESVTPLTAAQQAPVWKKEVLDTMERVAGIEDGRTKSLYTFAYYELLRNRAMASVKLPLEGGESRTLQPMAWFLDVIFRPAIAARYRIFNVEDSDALLQVGLNPHDKKRDKYSYEELAPARQQFFATRTRMAEVPPEKQSRLDIQINHLATNLIRYENLTHYLDFARQGIEIPKEITGEPLKAKAGQTIPLTAALPGLKAAFAEARTSKTPPPAAIFEKLEQILRDSSVVAWYAPPTADNPDAWAPPAGLIRDYLIDGPQAANALPQLETLEKLTALAADPAKNDEFQSAVQAMGQGLIDAAKRSNTYGKTTMDRGYLKAGLFGWAKWGFLLLFLLLALSWLAPASGWAGGLTKISLWGGALCYAIILAGITWRVLITGWGPVTNIYETIPFITLMAGGFALVMELLFKNRIALIASILCGAAGMFLAASKETGDAADTMPSLVAVLRSNYWLWTHVTTINLGYATVLLAAIFSMIYIFCRLFDVTRQNKALFRMLTQSAYGILCFGLVFSLVGTVLGGIWGNDSWGRFWGWDPKENGALVIVLWCLAVLHMRLAGWIRELGLHLCIAFGANFCFFSWWHVNLLNVGLHSYGFTAGLEQGLYIAYSLVTLVVLLGGVIKLLETSASKEPDSNLPPPLPSPTPSNMPG
jgi:ABC-type transport system involved in cytochrome c biogenesis permease subunit